MRSFRIQPASPQFTGRYSTPVSAQGRNSRTSTLAVIAFFVSAFLYLSHSSPHHKPGFQPGTPTSTSATESSGDSNPKLGANEESNPLPLKSSRPLLGSSSIQAQSPESESSSRDGSSSASLTQKEERGQGSEGRDVEDEVAVEDGRGSLRENKEFIKDRDEDEDQSGARESEAQTAVAKETTEDDASAHLKGETAEAAESIGARKKTLNPVLDPEIEDEEEPGQERRVDEVSGTSKLKQDQDGDETSDKQDHDAEETSDKQLAGTSTSAVKKSDSRDIDDLQEATAATASDEELGEKIAGDREVSEVKVSENLKDEPGQQALKGMFEKLADRDVVWQIPEIAQKRGTVFFAHGCHHKATDFWPKSSSCPDCIGLPEELELVRETLRRGYSAIAVSSAKGCWDLTLSTEGSEDLSIVVGILKDWRQKHDLSSLPMMAVGASSGGSFVTVLATAMKIDALAVMISPGVRKAMVKGEDNEASKVFPPTLFVHMPKDTSTAARVETSIRLLLEEGVEAAGFECRERKVSDEYFSNTIGLGQPLSEQIFIALEDAGLVSSSGSLKKSYRVSWESALEAKGLLERLDEAIKKAIEEELNVAFALHEFSSEHAQDIIDWFDGVCRRGKKFLQGRCKTGT